MAHIIREISIKDTEALTTLLTKIYDESDYTLYNPGEFNPSVSSISNLLERVITSPRNTIYVAEEEIDSLDVYSSLLKIRTYTTRSNHYTWCY